MEQNNKLVVICFVREMRKRDIKMDYRGWLFRDKVGLIPRDRLWKDYFEKKFSEIDIDVDFDTDQIQQMIDNAINSIEDNFGTVIEDKLHSHLCHVHKHIEEAKDHLCCDICCAKKDIKDHVDCLFDSINFEEQFSNLNEQAQRIIQKLDNL